MVENVSSYKWINVHELIKKHIHTYIRMCMCSYVYFCIEVSAHTHTYIRQISLKENWYSTIVPGKRLFFKDFIYLFMRERERDAETQAEGEASSTGGARCGT